MKNIKLKLVRGKMFSISNFINVVEDILDENKLKSVDQRNFALSRLKQ